MMEKIHQYIRNSYICTRAKQAKDQQNQQLFPPIPQRSWNDLAIYFITVLPVSSDACFPHSHYIWIITSWLTKKQHFIPCQDITATHLTRMFIQLVLHMHRLSFSIMLAYSTQFTSKF